MNIEEAIEMLKRIYVTEFNTSSIYDNVPNINLAIETLLTAYKEEKEKNKKLLSDNIESFQKYFSKELYTKFMDKEKLRKIIYPSPENPIPIEVQQSEMYKKLLKEMEE